VRRISKILGVDVDKLSTEGVLKQIEAFVSGAGSHQVSYINAHCLNNAFSDKDYYDILTDSDLVYPDGMSIVWASYLYGDPLPERVNLGDFLYDLCKLCVEKRYKIFLLGGGEGVAEDTASHLKKKFPNLSIVGTHSGFFDKKDNEMAIDKINSSLADIVLVGMGVPKQEKWIAKNKNKLKPSVLWGVGALFEYYANNVKRAPIWMRKIGFEWLFRLFAESSRLKKRYLIGNPLFLIRAFLPLIVDMGLVSLAWIIAYWFRILISPIFSVPMRDFRIYLFMLVFVALTWPLICSFFGLYRAKSSPGYIMQTADMIKASGTGLIFAVFISFAFREIGIARSFLGIWSILNLFLLVFLRRFLEKKNLIFLQRPSTYDISLPEETAKIERTSSKQNPIYIILKELLDKITALILVILTLPYWIVIAVVIKIDSKGPVFFWHKRVGKNGKPFNIYKFRTMHRDAQANAQAPSAKDDPRVTRVGKFLRQFSLDEIPQLINVIKGDMSLVGPRPEMPFIVETYQQWQRDRFLVKPGITGLWQIAGRKDLPLQDNIEYDFYYINNRSLILDLAILFETISIVFIKRGAY